MFKAPQGRLKLVKNTNSATPNKTKQNKNVDKVKFDRHRGPKSPRFFFLHHDFAFFISTLLIVPVPCNNKATCPLDTIKQRRKKKTITHTTISCRGLNWYQGSPSSVQATLNRETHRNTHGDAWLPLSRRPCTLHEHKPGRAIVTYFVQ